MSKTPFELRFDTLNFARNHLIDEYSAKAGLLNYVDGAERHTLIQELTYPSVDAVFELAERFKAFVNDQDTKPKPAPVKLDTITQRITEHTGVMLTEESFKRIFPDVPYDQPKLELTGEKPFNVDGGRIYGAYRAISTCEKAREGRLLGDGNLEKEIEEMERLRDIVKPAVEAKVIVLYDIQFDGKA